MFYIMVAKRYIVPSNEHIGTPKIDIDTPKNKIDTSKTKIVITDSVVKTTKQYKEVYNRSTATVKGLRGHRFTGFTRVKTHVYRHFVPGVLADAGCAALCGT